MTRILSLSDNNSRILTAPWSDPLEGGRGIIVQNCCHCISWEKVTTIKMFLAKMLFFLCFRPTMKFQGGSPVDPLFEPLPTPFSLDLSKIILIVISASLSSCSTLHGFVRFCAFYAYFPAKISCNQADFPQNWTNTFQ